VQLQSLRSQLNPHFVFNALSSIKHLIHEHDMSSAETYLGRFADLTRTILDNSEEELISLEDELRLLDNYLQMEQLRHPFTYTITTDDTINAVNTEIPAMLLQPLVENAVKHGVSVLQGKGIINISIKRRAKTLELMISDNGKGFVQETQQDVKKHKGLRLSQERIRLLNETYGNEIVSMSLCSSAGGAVINITLKDWLT
jgi:sensor histidine kinase YesM